MVAWALVVKVEKVDVELGAELVLEIVLDDGDVITFTSPTGDVAEALLCS